MFKTEDKAYTLAVHCCTPFLHSITIDLLVPIYYNLPLVALYFIRSQNGFVGIRCNG